MKCVNNLVQLLGLVVVFSGAFSVLIKCYCSFCSYGYRLSFHLRTLVF